MAFKKSSSMTKQASESASALLAMVAPTMPGRCLGVTTFLKRVVLRGVPFSRRFTGGHRQDARRGLCIGRKVDTQLNRHVAGSLRLDASNPEHQRVCHVVHALKRSGIRLVRAQFPAFSTRLGIRTQIDALGVRDDGEVVVVELKTTQHSYSEHRFDMYGIACSRQPVLTNSLPNSERTHHMLQAGFGAMCMKQLLGGNKARVSAVVVVSYKTVAVVHNVPQMFAASAWFEGANNQQVPLRHAARKTAGKKRAPKAQRIPWPGTDPRVASVLHARSAKRVNHANVCMQTHAVGLEVAGSPAVAVCMSKKAASKTQAAAWKRGLLKSAVHIFDAAPKHRTTPDAYVLCPGSNKQWQLVKL